MAIKKISVRNFRSFKKLDLELGNLNIIIGANASGKSNFLQILRFFRDLALWGQENAISLQGGIEYLRNLNIAGGEDTSFEIVLDRNKLYQLFSISSDGFRGVEISEISYSFNLRYTDREYGFQVYDECLRYLLLAVDMEDRTDKDRWARVIIRNKGDESKAEFSRSDSFPYTEEQILIYFSYLSFRNLQNGDDKTKLRLLNPVFSYSPVSWIEVIKNITFFDFDPKLPKKAVSVSGKSDFEEDGSNLAIVLKSIIDGGEKERKFLNILGDLLPFVTRVDIEKLSDKTMLMRLQEGYSGNASLPASLASDGTLSCTAIVVALYFTEKPLIVIEEPERNIHPHLIRKVANMIKEASEQRQIIVTTHNPEMIKYAELEDILFVSRNTDGFSNISRPSEKESVRTFIENNLNIEELFTEDLLES